MSLQAPQFAMRSKSPSRNSGSTKAVILVFTLEQPAQRHVCSR